MTRRSQSRVCPGRRVFAKSRAGWGNRRLWGLHCYYTRNGELSPVGMGSHLGFLSRKFVFEERTNGQVEAGLERWNAEMRTSSKIMAAETGFQCFQEGELKVPGAQVNVVREE